MDSACETSGWVLARWRPRFRSLAKMLQRASRQRVEENGRKWAFLGPKEELVTAEGIFEQGDCPKFRTKNGAAAAGFLLFLQDFFVRICPLMSPEFAAQNSKHCRP